MSTIDDGGPAFPVPSGWVSKGMSLRDWFAGQALAGLLADTNYGSRTDLVRQSFEYADAMIAARKVQP